MCNVDNELLCNLAKTDGLWIFCFAIAASTLLSLAYRLSIAMYVFITGNKGSMSHKKLHFFFVAFCIAISGAARDFILK